MQVVQSDLAQLERLFTLKNKTQIAENLTPELFQLLLDAHTQIHYYFHNVDLILEWQDDPEEEILSTLILWVETDLEVDEVLALETHFDNSWWMANRLRADKKLCIIVG
jgi:hypothetical protein